MEKRDKAFTLYKKGMGCTEISKTLGASLNTVKSWKKRYWDAQKGAPKKRTSSHPKGASSKCAQQDPAAQPEKRPNRGGAPKGNVNAVGNHGGGCLVHFPKKTRKLYRTARKTWTRRIC